MPGCGRSTSGHEWWCKRHSWQVARWREEQREDVAERIARAAEAADLGAYCSEILATKRMPTAGLLALMLDMRKAEAKVRREKDARAA